MVRINVAVQDANILLYGQDYNECHDEQGRFCSEGGGGASSSKPISQKDWERSLTHSEKNALTSYCSEGYKFINGYLRTGEVPKGYKALGKGFEETIQREINNLDSALGKSVLTEGTYYRGIDNKEILNNLDDLKEISDPGFMSTSYSPTYALPYVDGGGVLVEIHAPAGTKGADTESFNRFREGEVLIQKGSTLKFGERITQDDLKLNPNVKIPNNIKIIRAELVQ